MKLIFNAISEDELDVITTAPNRDQLCFGACVASDLLLLVRGDLATFAVPLTMFPPSGDGVVPDFRRLAVVDYGQTLRFGEYEACFETVIAEMEARST